MCCSTVVHTPNNEVVQAALTIGDFKLDPADNIWKRWVAEESVMLKAMFNIKGDLNFSMSPVIAAPHHHVGKRISAAIVFELAARIAEKMECDIVQSGVIAQCHPGTLSADIVIARYPDRLRFENVCPGFQAVFLGEHEHEVE